jgi:molybdate transport system ATP-binding protein
MSGPAPGAPGPVTRAHRSGRDGLRSRILVQRDGFELDVAIDVAAGEVVAVLGPNGSGKSSVLYALAGLLPLAGGRVAVDGQLWDCPDERRFVTPADRAVGLVFQDYRLFPHLSVLDNVAFSGQVRRTGRPAARREARREAGAWLDRVGLSGLAQRRPGELSGGQAQRTALARALASRPRMLLLDEPLAALDASTRLEVRSELREHLADFAGPCVVVTHDPLDALVLADRIIVLEGGRITQQGTPAEVARRPATEYVATLMGLNLYGGLLTDPVSRRVELDGGGTLHAAFLASSTDAGPCAASSHPPPVVAGSRLLVSVAPTAIAVHRERPGEGSPRNVWPATVTGLELLTDRIRVAVDGSPSALVDITPAALAALGLTAGSRIWLSAKATEVIAYPDPRQGTRPPRS